MRNLYVIIGTSNLVIGQSFLKSIQQSALSGQLNTTEPPGREETNNRFFNDSRSEAPDSAGDQWSIENKPLNSIGYSSI
jgi:hypothetical protein